MLSDDYEQEQEELREKLLQLNEEINQQEEQAENVGFSNVGKSGGCGCSNIT